MAVNRSMPTGLQERLIRTHAWLTVSIRLGYYLLHTVLNALRTALCAPYHPLRSGGLALAHLSALQAALPRSLAPDLDISTAGWGNARDLGSRPPPLSGLPHQSGAGGSAASAQDPKGEPPEASAFLGARLAAGLSLLA